MSEATIEDVREAIREEREESTEWLESLLMEALLELDDDDLLTTLDAMEDEVPMKVEATFPRHDPLIDADHGVELQVVATEDEDGEIGIQQFARNVPEHPDETEVTVTLPPEYAA